MGGAFKERRVHQVFITKNAEYHVRRKVCVAVRDRRTGAWVRDHSALRHRVCGGLRFTFREGVEPDPGGPKVGESVFFQSAGRDFVTDPVVRMERPPAAVAAAYPRE